MDVKSSSEGAASGSGGGRLLFCNGLHAADDFLKRWTHAQQQHQQLQQQPPPLEEPCSGAEAEEADVHPFEALASEQLQGAAHMVAQVPPLT